MPDQDVAQDRGAPTTVAPERGGDPAGTPLPDDTTETGAATTDHRPAPDEAMVADGERDEALADDARLLDERVEEDERPREEARLGDDERLPDDERPRDGERLEDDERRAGDEHRRGDDERRADDGPDPATVDDTVTEPLDRRDGRAVRTDAGVVPGEEDVVVGVAAIPATSGAGAQSTVDDEAGGDAAAQAAGGRAPEQATDGLAPGDVPMEPVADLWPADQLAALRERWREVQLRFVDDPPAAAADADTLVGEAIQTLTASLTGRRSDLAGWRGDGADDTERLRVAVRRYRDFLDRVLAL